MVWLRLDSKLYADVTDAERNYLIYTSHLLE